MLLKGVKKQYTVDCVAEFPDGEEVKFKATFRKLKRKQVAALGSMGNEKVRAIFSQDRPDKLTDLELTQASLDNVEELLEKARENLVGWDMPGEKEAEDDPDTVEFNDENVGAAFESTEYSVALMKGFMRVQTGAAGIAAKNS